MERILINNIDELLKFLSKPEINNSEVCKLLADAYDVFADPAIDKDEVLKRFTYAWNNYSLNGLEMPLFI